MNNVVAIYIRVSSDAQIEYSPDAQLKAIKEYAKKNNYEIDPKYIYKDEGISGRKAEKRPEFMKMIATAKTKPNSPFSKILVHKIDRFARNREDSIVYKSILKRECNVDVVSITEDFGDDKFSIILEAMLEAMAEYYSLNLSEEVMKGMLEKANRGEPMTKAPFGYILKDKQFYPHETNSKIVKEIFNKFENGDSLRTITNYLNELNITTNLGNKWEIRTVEYILKNPTYKGYLLWTPKSTMNEIFRKGNFEAIITEEQWDNIQNKIKNNKEKFKYKGIRNKQNWLRRLVKCSNCGSTLTPNLSYNSLQCIGYNHGICNESHYIKQETIKSAILNQIKKDFEDPININITQKKKTEQNEYDIIFNTINKLNEKLERYKSLYIEGIDTLEEYKKNKKSIEYEINQLEEKLSKLNVIHNENDETLSEFKLNAKNVYELLIDSKVNEDIKYTVIHELIEKVIFNRKENTIEIYYKI